MDKIFDIDKVLVVALVFLLSLSAGYYPITLEIYDREINSDPTRDSIWLSIK